MKFYILKVLNLQIKTPAENGLQEISGNKTIQPMKH